MNLDSGREAPCGGASIIVGEVSMNYASEWSAGGMMDSRRRRATPCQPWRNEVDMQSMTEDEKICSFACTC